MLNKDKKTCTCEVCGKIFAYVHGKGTKTCSKECLRMLKKNMFHKALTKKIVCKNCGKEFEIPHWQNSEFCSRKCYWEYRRNHKNDEYADVQKDRSEKAHEVRKCEWCGKEFVVYKKTKKRFCSDECRNAYLRTDEFQNKKRKTMLERYGMTSVGARSLKGVENKKAAEQRKEKQLKLCESSNVTYIRNISRFVLEVKCNKCGAVFQTVNLSYLPYTKIYCKHCDDRYKDYLPAQRICEFLDNNKITYIKNDRAIISPSEIDIYIPDKKLGIEINGNFWHSEKCGKDRKYHITKTNKCNELGIKLIHIFEDEILLKWEIVESRLKNELGLITNKIYARKCVIKEIDTHLKKQFNDANHIQGDTNSSINLGLFLEDKLVSVMTFGKERKIYKANTANDRYELIRFSNLLNTRVIGGFSKLLKYFVRNYNPKFIKTYADIRWSGENPDNTVYLKNGFRYMGNTVPNYWYMHKNNLLKRLHRYNFTKFSILKKHPELDKSKTEWELMLELGYNRIWDCGNMKFELYLE